METFAQFSVEGERLYGMLHLPTTPPPAQGYPSVILLHGFTGNRTEYGRSFVLLARRLAALGIAALRFDFRGCGDSQGDFAALTPPRQVDDVSAAAAYLRSQPGIDPLRVSLLGYSFGGLVAALSLSEVRPHRLLLWSPALPEIVLPMLRGGTLPLAVTDWSGWPVGRAFVQELLRVRPLEAAAAWGGTGLVLHGDADQTCPPEWGVRYAQALGCEAVAVPQAGHSYDSLEAQATLHQLSERFLLGSDLAIS